MTSPSLFLYSSFILFIIGVAAQDGPAYLRNVCLAFKTLYWPPTNRQFAVITVNHAGGWDPHHPEQRYNPFPLEAGVQLTEPENNYASYSYNKDDDNPSHTEPQVLGALHTLWNKFLNTHGRTPADVCLFTYNSPCSDYGDYDCASAIVGTKQNNPAFQKAQWYVGYNKMFQPRSQSKAQAEMQLLDALVKLRLAGIVVIKICNCAGKRQMRAITLNTTENTCTPSIQYQMYHCLRDTTFEVLKTCSSNPHSSLSMFINTAVWKCPHNNLTVGSQSCWKHIIDEHIGNHYEGLVSHLRSAIPPCVQAINEYHIGNPLQPAYGGGFATSEHVKDLRVKYTEDELSELRRCVNNKASGLLCSTYANVNNAPVGSAGAMTFFLCVIPGLLTVLLWWD